MHLGEDQFRRRAELFCSGWEEHLRSVAGVFREGLYQPLVSGIGNRNDGRINKRFYFKKIFATLFGSILIVKLNLTQKVCEILQFKKNHTPQII